MGSGRAGLIFAAFTGGFVVWGWRPLRALMHSTGDHPEVLSVPEPVDDVLTIRKMSAPELIPLLLFSAIGWGGLALSVASVFGLVAYEGSAVAGLLISGLFVLCGHGALMEHAVTVRLDRRSHVGVAEGCLADPVASMAT